MSLISVVVVFNAFHLSLYRSINEYTRYSRVTLNQKSDIWTMSTMTTNKFTHEDYTVGWICPLEVEQVAALEMLDEEHKRLPQQPADHNVYNLGGIAGHNVVIAGLHQLGNNPAATVVTQMRMTFPNLRFGLLVGIGGGVPVKTDNGMIRLGDVVVSKPAGQHSGAVQYDHGKAKAGQFERIGALQPPPAVLLNAAQDLAAKRARSRRDPVKENIKRIDTSIPGLRRYKHPGLGQDHLYKPDYIHREDKVPCDECGCDPSQRIQRLTDETDDESFIVVHRGTIASGEMMVKNAILRDQLAKEYGLLCFEMEAAGVLNDFPCIVIRGISDYCDSHKNDRWHRYAAAVAAAYARQLFFHMPIDEVKRCVLELQLK
jgi:nucleoside phosphorylase